MDLFVDNTSKGFFLDLLTNYVQLTQSSKVQIIRLSTQTLSLVESKEITFPSLPLLVDDAKKKYTSPLAIALYILEKSRTKHLLLGQAKDDFLNVSALFELLERKKPLDLLKHFGDILEKRTFLNKFHISLGDLYLFSYFYETIQHWDDETKVKNSSLFRWFYHIQSLPGIESFLTTTGKGLISFPNA